MDARERGAEHLVARLDELADGGMRTVEADGTAILLVRRGEAVHAVGATCPHAGADLSQGALCGDHVVCPWHKAVFSVSTGALIDPPAVDRLPRFQARIEAGQVFVTLPAEAAPIAAGRDADTRCFVIVGSGAAGALAAQTLREAGFGGRVVMLDRANRVPYDRTLLSKYFLSGEQGGEKSPLQPQSFYRAHAIERVTAEVVALDAASRRVTCVDGTMLNYDAALVAPGADPAAPPANGGAFGNVFSLRSRSDADRLLAAAERGARAVVIGAGFIGVEVAASLRERGLDVTVTAPEQEPFERQLGGTIGAVFRRLHESKGVGFRMGRKVVGFEGDGEARAVRLDDGSVLEADFFVAGLGVHPATAFLHGVNRREDGGIEVDAQLRAADGLYVAGDSAAFPLRGDGPRVRVEHWRVAEQQGRLAALNMLGRAARYDAVPVFWTIQYMKRLDYIGHAATWDDIVVHGDLGKPEFIAYYVQDGHVAAAIGWDRDAETAALVALMTDRRDWTPEALGPSPSRLLR